MASLSSTSSEDAWAIQPSIWIERTNNPIRAVVDTIKRPKNPVKEMIPLALGESRLQRHEPYAFTCTS